MCSRPLTGWNGPKFAPSSARHPARGPHRICARPRRPSSPLLQNLVFGTHRGFSFEAFIPRKFKSHSFAHRGVRVIDTDTLLRISLVLRVSSDGQEHEQDSEDNPNVNAHQGITVKLNAARTLAISRELCRVLSGRGLEIRPGPSRLVPPRAP